MSKLLPIVVAESTRTEAINHMALVSVLVKKGIVTEQELQRARQQATRAIDKEIAAKARNAEELLERQLAELVAKQRLAEGNLHYAIKSHQTQHRRSGKTSRFYGVDYRPRNRKWRARIKIAGEPRARNLGYFEEEEDAARAYNLAAQAAYGEHAKLNELD